MPGVAGVLRVAGVPGVAGVTGVTGVTGGAGGAREYACAIIGCHRVNGVVGVEATDTGTPGVGGTEDAENAALAGVYGATVEALAAPILAPSPWNEGASGLACACSRATSVGGASATCSDGREMCREAFVRCAGVERVVCVNA